MPEYLRLLPQSETVARPNTNKIVGIDRPVKLAMRELSRVHRLEAGAANDSDLEDIRDMNELRRQRGLVDTMALDIANFNYLNIDTDMPDPDPAA